MGHDLMKELYLLKEIDQVETAYGFVASREVKGVKARCSKIVPDQLGKVFPARMRKHGGESVDQQPSTRSQMVVGTSEC